MDPTFWKDKRVFLTGHTGFKGSWLSLFLARLGAKVTGFSLGNVSSPDMFSVCALERRVENYYGDIRNPLALDTALQTCLPETVFHLAAQPLVRRSYADPIETFETNVLGTANLLNAVRKIASVKAVVVVTSDKCYEENNAAVPHSESSRLGGHDPYSSSKACAEIVTDAYRKSFFSETETRIASARAGNVIGGGDWAIDRLVPDFIRAVHHRELLQIRSTTAIRPWQHVLDPLSGYLVLAQRLTQQGAPFEKAFNFGPDPSERHSVHEVLSEMKKQFPSAKWETRTGGGHHESKVLLLDSSRARTELGWAPRWTFSDSISRTAKWYRAWMDGVDMGEFSLSQIEEFCDVDGV